MMKLLLAEDDVVLGGLLKELLEDKSFLVYWAKDGEEAYDLYCKHRPEICILDVLMPCIDGIALAGLIRAHSVEVPIIFLSALSGGDDVVKGYEAGANDYLKKPFSIAELIARINELIRNGKKHAEGYQIGKYKFMPDTHVLQAEKRAVTLSSKESELLTTLIQGRNVVICRKDMLIRIWGEDSFHNSRIMDAYISRLRRFLRHDPGLSIITIRGFGFKLVEDQC